ncbi:(2Fe-2S)-binding protein [Polymorphum gilvum]|uniref:Ferredoxin n=1 Tax=Polymorphum gilvum (strain LMG 25793 / CGMCC 1.9160 / SL003B-26A1) TaxID=991905 RepID=F2IWZ8_POLGS|nr:(2Fe-2S)-binding protein [Polymorphum gilvum]ADZ71575.1 Ferredoxin [Polymorphum gilvum SL003B-26A1]
MSTKRFFWDSREIPFCEGETIAAALDAAGLSSFGSDALGRPTRYFCGIGACQGCLVRIDGVAREACLTLARDGLRIESLEHDDV